MHKPRTCWIAILAVVVTPAAGWAQVTNGQTDTFQGGTLLNWSQGVGSSGLGLANGGPGGASDVYMQITSTGTFGAGGRMIAFNDAQWTGSYTAAGVTTVEMDLRAPATNAAALAFRVALKDASGPAGNGYVSTVPFSVPNDAVWHHAVFQLTAANMTAVGTPAAFNTFMQGVAEMRVLHAVNPALNGDRIVAVVGVDNIHAGGAPVPEPAGVLAVAGLVGVAACRVGGRRRRGLAPAGV